MWRFFLDLFDAGRRREGCAFGDGGLRRAGADAALWVRCDPGQRSLHGRVQGRREKVCRFGRGGLHAALCVGRRGSGRGWPRRFGQLPFVARGRLARRHEGLLRPRERAVRPGR
jgi:hypothetical protein